MKKKINFIKYILSILFIIFNLSGCLPPENSNTLTQESLPYEESTENNRSNIDLIETYKPISSETEEIARKKMKQFGIDRNPNEYVGDIETFVYGLIIQQLEYAYYTFPAYITLSTDDSVYGIAYTSFNEAFIDEEKEITYFSTGFLPFCGELEVSEEEFNSGLFIYDLESSDESTGFIWKYKCEPYSQHCVVFNYYLTYGINELGNIFYDIKPYEKGYCNETLGSLYSYDEEKYLFDNVFGDYIPITGNSLSIQLNYKELEQQTNEYINRQNYNLYSNEIENSVYIAQEAIKNYFLSTQEETFLGYPVETLLEIANDLNPLECIRITSEGIFALEINPIPPEEPTKLVKWLVGSIAAIHAIAGIVVAAVFIEFPPVSAAAGAISAAAISLFMEVVVFNHTLKDVNWLKIGVSAVMGAISGFIGPYLQTFGKIAYVITDTILDGVLAATEEAIFAFIEGARGIELVKSFGIGFVIGAAFSLGIKGVGKIISSIASSPKISDFVKKIATKMENKIPAFVTTSAKQLKNAIGDGINSLKKSLSDTWLCSKYISNKTLEMAAARLTDTSELYNKSVNELKKNINNNKIDLCDLNGNKISFDDDFIKYCKNAGDGIVAKYIYKDGEEYIEAVIKKEKGLLSLYFDDKLFDKVEIDSKHFMYAKDSITFRTENLTKASDKFAKKFYERILNNPDSPIEELMPKSIYNLVKEYADKNQKTVLEALETIEAREMYKIIQKSSYTLHEQLDGTVILVPSAVHNFAQGGIAHMGLVAYEKYIKNYIGRLYFDTFLEAASNGFNIGVY